MRSALLGRAIIGGLSHSAEGALLSGGQRECHFLHDNSIHPTTYSALAFPLSKSGQLRCDGAFCDCKMAPVWAVAPAVTTAPL